MSSAPASLAVLSVPPRDRFDKIDGVLSGRFRIAIGGESVILEAGDFIRVPRGAVHSAEVVGGESVVSLDAIRA